MARLIYSMLTSLDGYVADESGSFDWAAPDEEVHAVVNEMGRSVGTFLLGRRMYDVLVAWETMELADEPPVIKDFAAIWRAADKIVYSRTLERVASARTRIERNFDPAAVERLKESSARDISVGGPDLAGQALRAGLVDECDLFLMPVTVGGGTRCIPDGIRTQLVLLDERRFASGVVEVRYRTSPP